MMQNVWIIARRELGALFVQPIAYVFIATITFITGLIFAAQIGFLAQGSQAPVSVADSLSTFAFLGLFVVPSITMRLLSEERQSGTIELLMTMPVTDAQVILGKFVAAIILWIVTTAITLIYPFVLLRFGNPDVGPMLTSYLMVLLWGSALISIGLFTSTISTNQINAFMLSFVIILLFYLLTFLSNVIPVGVPLGEAVSQTLRDLSFLSHQSNLLNGVITATDILYFVLMTAIFLFAAARILESRRWR